MMKNADPFCIDLDNFKNIQYCTYNWLKLVFKGGKNWSIWSIFESMDENIGFLNIPRLPLIGHSPCVRSSAAPLYWPLSAPLLPGIFYAPTWDKVSLSLRRHLDSREILVKESLFLTSQYDNDKEAPTKKRKFMLKLCHVLTHLQDVRPSHMARRENKPQSN